LIGTLRDNLGLTRNLPSPHESDGNSKLGMWMKDDLE